jgi:hypothetical protein
MGQEVGRMPRFVAVHPVAFTAEQLQPLAKEVLPEGVIWHDTFCAFGESKTYCHWEAPTGEALRDIFTKYEVPYELIHEVRRFDPSTGLLEPEPIPVKVAIPV